MQLLLQPAASESVRKFTRIVC